MATSGCEAFPSNGSGLIEDEKFDFDIPVSPNDCNEREIYSNDLEDEDEVFFGPVGHRERCVNSGLQDDDNFKPMSPLNSEQIAELFKEATAVSIFIKSSSLSQSLGNEDMVIDQNESKEICKILSKTFSIDEDQENAIIKPDQENGATCRTGKSASSPESVDSISPQPEDMSDDIVIPSTPRQVLKEKNSQDAVFQSPFKGRKARPVKNVSKFTHSKLPKTQMTLKTRSCFNSPIKVEHLYGIATDKMVDETRSSTGSKGASKSSNVGGSSKVESSVTEASKLPLPSQSGIRPPGFGVQPRRRRTSSTSSVSSTSSALSHQSNDMNETFVVLKDSSSDIPSIPNVCPRKVPTTKASLKPVNGTNALSKPAFTRPKGRPQPVKALAPSGICKKAPRTPNDPLKSSKVLRSTPGCQTNGVSTDKELSRPPTPGKIQRSKTFTTPVKRSSISTGQPVKSAQTPTRAKKSEVALTPRRRGSATPKESSKTVPTPVRRRSSVANKTEPAKAKKVPRPVTPENVTSVSSDNITPPNPVPSKVLKRKSLSASGQKRRSLLPTPMGSKITRSQSQRSRPRSVNCEAKGALPFNISPSGEIKPKTAGASKSRGDVTREQSCSRSSFSDPFSPACQTVTVDSTENYGTGDSVVRNLIELSPMAKEGNLIDI